MTPGARLAALLEALPGDALLPASWIRAQLGETQPEGAAPAPADTLARDLTVKEFGALFGKSASTARLWCEQEKIEGAWKLNGREWRVPMGSVEKFRQAQGAPAEASVRLRRGELGDWRKRRKAG